MGGSAGQDGQQADNLHRGTAGGVSGERGQDGGGQLDVLQRGVKGGEVSAVMAQQNADHIRSASCC